MMRYSRRNRWWKAAGVALVLVGLGALAVVWPAPLGGSVTYVTTRGSSMEPAFHQGDLALIRPADHYQVGDVVAYHSRLLHTIVMHRIVERHGDRYIFQGDNNSWLDRDQPTYKDLVGALWVRVPKGGLVAAWVRTPAVLLAGLAFVLLAGGAMVSARHRHRHRRRGALTMASRNVDRQPIRAWLSAAIVCAALAAACAAVGAVAFTRPTTAPASQTVRYTQHGAFTYRAAVAPGPVYDDGTVSTGDPVFLRLVQAVNVAFTYQFDAVVPRAISGTIGLRAEITSGNGWRHSIELQPATPFSGDRAEVHAVLDAAQLQGLITQVETLTGAQDATHTIMLLPDVQATGMLAGHEFHGVFAPRLDFTLDRYQLRLAQPATKATDTAFTPVTTGTLRHRVADAPGELHLFGRSVAVTDARRVATALGVLFAFGVVAALVGLRRRWRGQASRIELRLGHRLVPVTAQQPQAQNGTVDLTSIQDLVRLADQHASLILHRQIETGDVYLFQADRTTYRYMAPPTPPQEPPPVKRTAAPARRGWLRGRSVRTSDLGTVQ